MLKKQFRSFKNIFLFLVIFFNFFMLNASGEVIKKFNISGNDRISDETIKLFTGFKLNDDIDQNNLNLIIKNLYETLFFKNISINFENNILEIIVEENPLIQSIAFNGIKRQSLISQLKQIIKQKEKSSFIKNKIKQDQDIISNTLCRYGRIYLMQEIHWINIICFMEIYHQSHMVMSV